MPARAEALAWGVYCLGCAMSGLVKGQGQECRPAHSALSSPPSLPPSLGPQCLDIGRAVQKGLVLSVCTVGWVVKVVCRCIQPRKNCELSMWGLVAPAKTTLSNPIQSNPSLRPSVPPPGQPICRVVRYAIVLPPRASCEP